MHDLKRVSSCRPLYFELGPNANCLGNAPGRDAQLSGTALRYGQWRIPPRRQPDCAWNGPQNKRDVVRLIGMVDALGLIQPTESSPGKKKGGGGVQLPDLPLNNK